MISFLVNKSLKLWLNIMRISALERTKCINLEIICAQFMPFGLSCLDFRFFFSNWLVPFCVLLFIQLNLVSGGVKRNQKETTQPVYSTLTKLTTACYHDRIIHEYTQITENTEKIELESEKGEQIQKPKKEAARNRVNLMSVRFSYALWSICVL